MQVVIALLLQNFPQLLLSLRRLSINIADWEGIDLVCKNYRAFKMLPLKIFLDTEDFLDLITDMTVGACDMALYAYVPRVAKLWTDRPARQQGLEHIWRSDEICEI